MLNRAPWRAFNIVTWNIQGLPDLSSDPKRSWLLHALHSNEPMIVLIQEAKIYYSNCSSDPPNLLGQHWVPNLGGWPLYDSHQKP